MMRDIVFLAHRVPWPPDRGDKIRSWNILKHLAGLARVHLVAFADDDGPMPPLELASCHIERARGGRVRPMLAALATCRPASVAAFDSPPVHRVVARLLAEHDIGTIFAFSGQMAQFVPPTLEALFLMDFVDVDSEKFAAYGQKGSLPMRWLYQREARLLARYEQAVAHRADFSLFVSEAEARLFREANGMGGDRVRAIENGIDLEYLDPRRRQESPGLIVFTGQMDYPPNVEAVQGFATRTFPAIKDRCPDARFAIVGRNPTAAVRVLADNPGIIVTGGVPDVRPWLANASVVVAPLAIARGIQNKVLEAMAMARAVVASPAAAEGIDVVPGQDIIVADGDGMASAVAALLENPEQADAIGISARARMEVRYRWDAQLAPLDRLLG